jgi:peptidylprolyl isomerase
VGATSKVSTSKGRAPSPRNTRRAAFRAAAAQRAAAQRRQQMIQKWGFRAAGLLVAIGLVVWAVVALGDNGSKSASAGASSSASGSASAKSAAAVPTDPALGKKPEVKAGSGDVTELKVTTLVEGTGPAVTSGQTISVNYVGVSYKTGVEFDSSWSRSQAYSFKVGAGKVITGWDQGLVGVKVGSRVQLDIPSAMAYGDDASSGRPTGPLRFVVDVLSAS